MIRIGDLNPNEPNRVTGPGTGQAAARPDAAKGQFSSQFEAARAVEEQHTLEDLIGKVDLHAQMLLKSPTYGSVIAYREAVRRFMKEISAKLGRVDKKTDRRNRTLVMLRNLDDKLAQLTEAILKGQANAVDLAASINEIRGLVLDLLV
jgi:hypothetical protein